MPLCSFRAISCAGGVKGIASGLMLVSLLSMILLSGCASPVETHRSYADESVTDPTKVGTLLSTVGSPSVSGFISTGYIGGPNPDDFELDDLHPFAEETRRGVTVEVRVPEEFVDRISSALRGSDKIAFSEYLKSMASAIKVVQNELATLSNYGLHVVMLAAPVGEGVIVTHEDSLDDNILKIVVGNAFDQGSQTAGWMLSGLTTVVHELLHVHYRLNGIRKFDFQTRKAANEEAAAFLFGWCGGIRAQRQFGSNSMDMSFNINSMDRFFPGLDAGRYCPNWDNLSTLSDRATRGKVLALTTLSLANPQLRFDAQDSSTTQAIFEICRSLPAGIPDFLSGDVPTLQDPAECSN